MSKGDLRDFLLFVVIVAVSLAFVVHSCSPSKAAEVQGPPAPEIAAPKESPVLIVVYACPAGSVATVTNNPDIHLAHMMVVIGRITWGQYLATIKSIRPDFVASAEKFLFDCFGAAT